MENGVGIDRERRVNTDSERSRKKTEMRSKRGRKEEEGGRNENEERMEWDRRGLSRMEEGGMSTYREQSRMKTGRGTHR